MPELPEVETIRRGLSSEIVGLKIKSIATNEPKMLQLGDVGTKAVVGAQVKDIRRRAKILLIDLDNGFSLLIHLKLTGQLIYQNIEGGKIIGDSPVPPLNKPTPNATTHITITFDNATHLFFNDLRKFGYVKLFSTKEIENLKVMQEFGPEPFTPGFSLEYFREGLKKRGRTNVKVLLLDQSFIGGIGNIYANEALYEARISPLRSAVSLSDNEVKKLYSAIMEVLERGLKAGGASDQTYVNAFGEKGRFMETAKVYGRLNQSCKECSGNVKRITLGGRGTFYCPSCQK
ncbi:MAG: bifunctional DNA-formamidopyrimidine glycosylase/DNA-(apurinic or apyrimidinic site) lyase [Patescibacteria group bacterium]|nr:bifunctional DNA-formamidopyrimidine glycosylase/DNA-(apurinic or apyrimidinic site) lyase [Patescibacteria group bacterium]